MTEEKPMMLELAHTELGDEPMPDCAPCLWYVVTWDSPAMGVGEWGSSPPMAARGEAEALLAEAVARYRDGTVFLTWDATLYRVLDEPRVLAAFEACCPQGLSLSANGRVVAEAVKHEGA